MKELTAEFLAEVAANAKREGRHLCLPGDAWSKDKNPRSLHPYAEYVEGGEYYDTYQCPICGLRFKETLPDS